jgi:hypothetical protein
VDKISPFEVVDPDAYVSFNKIKAAERSKTDYKLMNADPGKFGGKMGNRLR